MKTVHQAPILSDKVPLNESQVSESNESTMSNAKRSSFASNVACSSMLSHPSMSFHPSMLSLPLLACTNQRNDEQGIVESPLHLKNNSLANAPSRCPGMNQLSCFYKSSHSLSHQTSENEILNHDRVDEDEEGDGCESNDEDPENYLQIF